MATKGALQSAWAAFGQALGNACAGTGGTIGGQCTGAIFRHAQLSGRAGDWNKLPASSPGYDGVIASLNAAGAQLAAGASAGSLASAGQAMNQVESLLDNA